jgi:hypothetical protein
MKSSVLRVMFVGSVVLCGAAARVDAQQPAAAVRWTPSHVEPHFLADVAEPLAFNRSYSHSPKAG